MKWLKNVPNCGICCSRCRTKAGLLVCLLRFPSLQHAALAHRHSVKRNYNAGLPEMKWGWVTGGGLLVNNTAAYCVQKNADNGRWHRTQRPHAAHGCSAQCDRRPWTENKEKCDKNQSSVWSQNWSPITTLVHQSTARKPRPKTAGFESWSSPPPPLKGGFASFLIVKKAHIVTIKTRTDNLHAKWFPQNATVSTPPSPQIKSATFLVIWFNFIYDIIYTY